MIEIASLEDPMGTLRKLTGGPMTTPVIVINGAARAGFDPEWMTAQLDADPETTPAGDAN